MRMLFAGMASVCSGSVTHPLETVKTRMQMQGEVGNKSTVRYDNVFKGAQVIVRNEGFTGLFKGLPATWMRESIYSTLRLGLYEPFK